MTMKKLLLCLTVLCAAGAGACVTAPPSKDRVLTNQAYKEIQGKDYDKAKSLLTEALKLNPQNAFAWLNLGVVHQELQEYEQARKCYLKVVENAWDEQGGNEEVEGRSLVRVARDNLEKMPSR